MIKRDHSYYYQVQMQMHETEPEHSDFVVWSPEEFFVERLHIQKTFVQVHFHGSTASIRM